MFMKEWILIAGFLFNLVFIILGVIIASVKFKSHVTATNKAYEKEFKLLHTQITSHHDVFYKDGRTLALVSIDACIEKRNVMHEKIRGNEKTIARYFRKSDAIESEMKIMNINMIKLMIKLDVTPSEE